MTNKLIEIIEEKLDNDSLDEYGDYIIDKLLFGVLEIDINSDKYEIYLYDETEYFLIEECWLAYLQIFEVSKNNEVIGYIGRENKMSCCGDTLIKKDTSFNTTFMIKIYSKNYKIENIYKEMGEFSDCKCNQLFTSNRREGCITMKNFYDKRFERRISPFSPKYQYIIE